MNKTELIEAVAEAAGLTKTDSDKAVNALLDTVQAAVQSGDKVTIPGFGSFSVSDRKARTGRNPQTGEQIKISARRVLTFRPSQVLKAMLNGEDVAAAIQNAGEDEDDED